MKGFPNQIAELTRLAQAMQTLSRLVNGQRNPKDDGIFGEALVRDGVLGTGHIPIPIEQYITQQRAKPTDRQSFRTSARGLRELFRLLDFIDDSGNELTVTRTGQDAANFAGMPLDARQISFWRRAIRDIRHYGGNAEASHPYQVMLRLISRVPGITRAMCALALEARNDSQDELDRIVALAALSEEAARRNTQATLSNWNNAKKILPKFAEQLGDVIKRGDTFHIADAPGRAEEPNNAVNEQVHNDRPRGPRSAHQVTPETIARAGTTEDFDEARPPTGVDPAVAAAAEIIRRDRLRRHNMLVQQFALQLQGEGIQFFENPFDVLAVVGRVAVLAEMKTLDGSRTDERDRVREAFGQLLYYDAFVTRPVIAGNTVRKIACFERRITDEHRSWLNDANIAVVWLDGQNHLVGDLLAEAFLRDLFREFRRG